MLGRVGRRSSRRRRDVNRTANPEVEMADRVTALVGSALTEADVHHFLLEAADILGTESFAVYGPDLFFRWRVGQRVCRDRTGLRLSDWRILLARGLLQPRVSH